MQHIFIGKFFKHDLLAQNFLQIFIVLDICIVNALTNNQQIVINKSLQE
jgi:hypothetical protein